MEFGPPYRINNSIVSVVEHIAAACQFITGRLTKFKGQQNPICPFQIDLAFAVGKPLTEEFELMPMSGSDDDDNDDDDDDEAEECDDGMNYVDYIGDIAAKLKVDILV